MRRVLLKLVALFAFGLVFAAPFHDGSAAADPICSAQEAPLGGIGYVPLNPVRLLDTRPAHPTVDGLFAGGGPLGDQQTLDLTVVGRGGVPATGVGAVVLNVTAVDQSVRSFLTIYPTGSPRPLASNLNPNPGIVQPNLVIAKVGANGEISIYNNAGALNVIADVQGWYPSPLGQAYNPLVPARVLETRSGLSTTDGVANGGGALSEGQTLTFKVTGRGGVPASGVAAVVLNVTATDQTRPTFLTVFPSGTTRPNASDLNPNPGVAAPNLVIAKVGDDGNVSVYNNSGSVQVIADVQGWFPIGPAYTAVDPARLLETRLHLTTIDGLAESGGAIGPNATMNLKVTGRGGVPLTGVGAVVLNITATNQTSNTFLTVYPAGSPRPEASNLNPFPGLVAPNLVIARVGAAGEISIYNNAGSVDVIADVHGWFPTDVSATGSSIAPAENAQLTSRTEAGIVCVNEAPSFVKGVDQVVDINSTTATVPAWATAISPGGATDTTQVVDFIVTNDNPTLFATQPAISPTGVLTYAPAAGRSGVATVSVRIHDDGGTSSGGIDTSAVQSFRITVNAAPVAAGATLTTNEDTSLAVALTGTDPDGNALTFSIVSGPTKGTLGAIGAPVCGGSPSTCVATVAYAPSSNSNGADTFTYRTSDGRLASNTATVTIGVTAVNDAPSFTKGGDELVLEDGGARSVAAWATAISNGPADESAQTHAFNVSNNNTTLFSIQPTVAPNGTLTYTPAPDGNGIATVTVSLSDSGGTANGGQNSSVQQTFTITVTAVNDAPSFAKGADLSTPTQSVPGWATGISAGPSNESTQTISFVVTNDNNALFSVQPAVSPTGTLTYTPAPGISGVANVDVSIHDSGGTAGGGIDTSAVQTLVITVNTVPTADDTTAGVLEDGSVSVNLSAGDVDGDPLTFAIVAGPASGSLGSISAPTCAGVPSVCTATVTYTPDADSNGVDTFTYRVKDSALFSSSATATVTVTSVNDAPAGADKTVTTAEGSPYVFGPSDFSITDPNDTPTNALAGVRITALPSAGTLADNGLAVTSGQSIPVADLTGGLVTFTPAANANGAAYASFTFQVRDDGGVTNGGVDLDPSPNTVTVDVSSVNSAPAGTDATVSTLEDMAKVFAAADFGFTDPNDSPANTLLAVKVSTLPGVGTLLDDGVAVTAGDEIAVADITGGLLTFTPAADANGAGYAAFTFQVEDDGGGTDLDASPNTLTIDVTAVNDAPGGTDATVSTAEDTTKVFTASNFGFTDPNDTPADTLLAVTITTLANAGTLSDNGSAVVVGQSIPVADIAGGLLTFTPAANAHGANYASFTFQVQDNGGTANSGVSLDPSPNTLTMDVSSVNDAPSGTDGTVTAVEDTAKAFTASNFGFTDSDDSPADALLAVTISTVPGAGTISDGGVAVTAGQTIAVADITGGLLTFTPAANANGAGYASFTFQVQDNGGGSDLDLSPNTLTIDVTAVNDAPSGTNHTVTALEDTDYVFATADFPYTDPNDSPANALLAVKISTLAADGELRINGIAVTTDQSIAVADISAGLLTFTPATNASGANYTTFAFQMQDDGGIANGGFDLDLSPNTLTVDVVAVNDAPSGTDRTVSAIEDTPFVFASTDFPLTDPTDSPANVFAGVKITTVPSGGTLRNGLTTLAPGDLVSKVSIDGNGLTYTPNANANGAAQGTFTFQVQDNGGTANGGVDIDPSANTLTIDVAAVNDAPVAPTQTFAVETNMPRSITVALSDPGGPTDPDSSDASFSDVYTLTSVTNGSCSGCVITSLDLVAGTFVVEPPAGLTGSFDLAYTVTDNGNPAPGVTSAAGKITITVAGPVIWFVDPTNGDDTHTGTLAHPFKSLGHVTSVDGASHKVFLYSGGSSTTGIALKTGEWLIGQATTSSGFDAYFSITPPAETIARPAMGSGTSTSAGTVTLAANAKVQGITIVSTTSPALNDPAGAITGVDVSETALSTTTGTALQLSGVTGGLSFTDISKDGAGTAISLTNVAADTTVAAGTIKNTTVAAVDIDQGVGGFTYAGTIDNTSGRTVEVTNRTDPAPPDPVEFTGRITGGGSGINLDNNDTGVITFSGDVDLSTGTSVAFSATNGGTVSATNTGSSITTTTGTALNVQNTTIGASGLTFERISSNGAANGIVLNATGTAGGLAVTGTGGSCTSAVSCTGGAIQNATVGVSLNSTQGISISRMFIQNTTDSGVRGTAVKDFSFTNGRIDNSGTAGGTNTSNIAFNTTALGTESNLSGAVMITGNTLTNALYHGIDIFDYSGTITAADVSGNTITSTNSTVTSKGSGIRLVAFGGATTAASVTKATINGNDIQNFPSGAGIVAQGGNANAGGPTGTFGTVGNAASRIDITNNLIMGFGTGAGQRMGTYAIQASVNGKGQGNFNISANGTLARPITNIAGTVISNSALGHANVATIIANNVIVANHQTDFGGPFGISVGAGQTFGSADDAHLSVTITNNAVSQTDSSGIKVLAGEASATVDATIKNNVVGAPIGAGAANGIRIDSGTASGVNNAVCLDIAGNTSAGESGQPGIGLRKQGTATSPNAFGIEGMAATASPDVQTYVNTKNPAGNGTFLISATSGFSNCSSAP